MKNQNSSRRNFLKKAAFGAFAAISIPEILSASMIRGGSKKVELRKGYTILFQGDSITDSNRNKEDNGFNNTRALGTGYAMLAGAALLEKYASLELKIYNKGISGNKVYQLAERWDKDCLEIQPDVLSILIGVNDIWHKYKREYKGTLEIYRNDYIALLEKTKKALPGVKLIIGEPFAVKGGSAVEEIWYPEFYGYQKAAAEIASQFGAVFIPFQSIYDEAVKRAPGTFWSEDGVHPTLAGSQLMAKAWLTAIR